MVPLGLSSCPTALPLLIVVSALVMPRMAAESLPAVVPLSPLHCPLRPGRDLAATVVETVTAPAAHAVVADTAVVVVAVAAVGWLKEGRAWSPRSDGAQTKNNPWRLRLIDWVKRDRVGQACQAAAS